MTARLYQRISIRPMYPITGLTFITIPFNSALQEEGT
jgi:hypothetical protein